MENEKSNISKIIIGVIACFLVLLGFLGSYAYFTANGTLKNEEDLSFGVFYKFQEN